MKANCKLMAADTILADPRLDFQLIERIGMGGYESVHKARDLRTKKFVAVKVVEMRGSDSTNEVTLLRICEHINVISYLASYMFRDKMWIVMNYASGGSLYKIYKNTGALNENQIAFICRETLQGLSYLHLKFIIHRDIKGANILLMETGEVKIADLGVATRITPFEKCEEFMGTSYWMAPEVADVEFNDGYDHLCDIWSLGITAFELAETRPPLCHLKPMEVLSLLSEDGYQPPTLKEKEKWSPDFHSVLECALTTNPMRRPTADQLLKHPFFERDLSKKITFELLQQYHNSKLFNVMGNEEAAPETMDILNGTSSHHPAARKYQQLTTDQSSSPDIISRDMKQSNNFLVIVCWIAF